MKTKTELLHMLESERDQLRQFGIGRIGLFGSYSRDEQTQTSDIDVLVEFEPGKKTFRNLLGFSEYIETILDRHVDVVTPESMSPYIAPHIKNDISYVQVTR